MRATTQMQPIQNSGSKAFMVRRLSVIRTAGQSRTAEASEELGVASAAEFARDEDGERDKRRARERRKNTQRRQRTAHPQRDLGIHGDERSGIDITPIEMASHIEVVKLVTEVAVMPDAGEEVQQELDGTEANQNANCERRKRRTAALLSQVIEAGLTSTSDIHKLE